MTSAKHVRALSNSTPRQMFREGCGASWAFGTCSSSVPCCLAFAPPVQPRVARKDSSCDSCKLGGSLRLQTEGSWLTIVVFIGKNTRKTSKLTCPCWRWIDGVYMEYVISRGIATHCTGQDLMRHSQCCDVPVECARNLMDGGTAESSRQSRRLHRPAAQQFFAHSAHSTDQRR